MRLRRKSIAALVEYLEENKTRAEVLHLLRKHGFDPQNPEKSILRFLGDTLYTLTSEETDETKITGAIELFEEIAQSVYDSAYPLEQDLRRPDDSDQYREIYDRFRQALRADDLDLVEGRIAPLVSPSVNVAKEQGFLESRLQKFEFREAFNHLEQAVDNAATGNWEASNGQIRSFLEALCNAIADRIYKGANSPPSGGKARKYLEKVGFLSPNESKLLKAFFQVLHVDGSHAGTSSSDDCHRRRLMVLAMANYYLEQLEDWEKGASNAT